MSKRFREIKKQSNEQSNTKDSNQNQMNNYYVYRIKALIVDLFMIYVPILYIIAYIIMDGKDDFQSSELAPLLGTIIYGVIYAVFLSRTGQTPGKRAYEIKVVDAKTFQNIGFFRAFLRFLAFIFTATTLLGLFLPLVRKDNKMLHDMLLSTSTVAIEKV